MDSYGSSNTHNCHIQNTHTIMAETNHEPQRPHIVMVPVPTQGHIIPMFKLAKLLHHQGFHITFLNTEFNHRRLLRSHGLSSLDGQIPNFDFASIPDGLPPSNENATQDAKDIKDAVGMNLMETFNDFLNGLITSSNAPPVTCIIVDAFMSFAFEVAQKLSIPTVQFVIFGAGPLLSLFSCQNLIDEGLLPLKDESWFSNGYLETEVNCIPGLEGIQLKHLSKGLLTTDLNDITFNQIKAVTEMSQKGSSSAILFNTFHDLESTSIEQLLSLYSTTVLSIGPIHLLENQVQNDALNSFSANLWEEDSSCLKWLDSKPPNSVIFVSFGSIASLTTQQMLELAWGLANSKHNFLWVIRPDLVRGDGESNILPPEFDVEIKDRAFITSWCPQQKVLSHPAIGGFLTQCGWNSLLESLCAGVPLLCWPNWDEQVTNTWFCCNKWNMGLEIDNNNFNRDKVERLVKELMSGEKGKVLKENVMEWKKKAEEAAIITGSSNTNFEKLVKLLKSL